NTKADRSPVSSAAIEQRIKADLLPYLGQRPINDIKAPELLAALRRAETRGAVYTAANLRSIAGRVFRFAVATGRAERDPSGDLRGVLTGARVKHRGALTEPTAVGGLLRAIDGYQGSPVTRAALQLSPLLFQRPGEMRGME